VRLRLRRDEGQELIEVIDEGPGMSGETLSRAFERHYSGNGGRGVGVGLTIAKSIAEQHGGSIEVSSVLGQGSVFAISLPSLASQLVEQGGELLA
jgi:signal transduction histidine kinase